MTDPDVGDRLRPISTVVAAQRPLRRRPVAIRTPLPAPTPPRKAAPARAKANAVRKNNARLQSDEFQARWDRAREQGAKTDAAVAKAFNDTGYLTAQGLRWTGDNVARMRRRLPSFDKAPIPFRPRPATPEPLFTPDNRMTDEGFRRCCGALSFLGVGEKKPSADRLLLQLAAARETSLHPIQVERLTKLVHVAEFKMSEFFVSEGLTVEE